MSLFPSDINILVDGSTYPGWKMSCFEKQKTFSSVVKNTAGLYPGPVAPSAADGASLGWLKTRCSKLDRLLGRPRYNLF